MELKDMQIQFSRPGSELQVIHVQHTTETFDFELDGTQVSLINNGDNSWSIVNGDIDQETANGIGDAIEQKIRETLGV
jgi:hypothetical protein